MMASGILRDSPPFAKVRRRHSCCNSLRPRDAPLGVVRTQVQGRLHPLGLRTQFHFEYGPDTRYLMKTPPTYGGLEITPRLVFANLAGLKPGTKYHYRLVA